MNNKPIPSPFSFNDKNADDFAFMAELEKLVEKYRYRQFLIVFSHMNDMMTEEWRATSNVISEQMVEYVQEQAIPFMQKILEQNEE
jgi:hypothetical protein